MMTLSQSSVLSSLGKEMNVKCICGTSMVIKHSSAAYNVPESTTWCDSCTLKNPLFVFHCPQKQNDWHASGHDYCLKCAVHAFKTQIINQYLPNNQIKINQKPQINHNNARNEYQIKLNQKPHINHNNARNAYQFDAHLLSEVLKSEQKGNNIVISPFSILSAMTMTMVGASNNTLKEMLNVLHPHSNPFRLLSELQMLCKHLMEQYSGIDGKPLIKIANKLWIGNTFEILRSFINTIGEDPCGANTELIDFNFNVVAADIINKWCSKVTNNMIKDAISPSDICWETKLIITNAIYFKGKFVGRFDKNKTKQNVAFYGNKVSQVTMMYSDTNRLFAQNVNGYDVVKLKYENSKISLNLVMNNSADIQSKQTLTMKEVQSIFKRDNINPKPLNLYVPKFKSELGIELSDILQRMGIIDAFDPSAADFSNITKHPLFISKIIHKAVIEIDEQGTEAAAFTAVCMSMGLSSHQPPTMRFDHPFAFHLYDEANDITLFSGHFLGSSPNNDIKPKNNENETVFKWNSSSNNNNSNTPYRFGHNDNVFKLSGTDLNTSAYSPFFPS
eukprot:454693_1